VLFPHSFAAESYAAFPDYPLFEIIACYNYEPDLWSGLASLQTFVHCRMNMTNETAQKFTLGKGDTQKLYISAPEIDGPNSLAAEDPPEPPIHAPREPARRQEFWLDTCRGVAHVQIACAQVQNLYRKHGCRFAEPTLEQIRGILDALDRAMPQWEREHPELFYQTLELSFPELVIRR
jgi:hypothetical protein